MLGLRSEPHPEIGPMDHSADDGRVNEAVQKALSSHAETQRAIRANVTKLLRGTIGEGEPAP
jgi:hypothetical protein